MHSWASSGGDTCHLPWELQHRTPTRSSIVSPLIVSASNHRLALGTKVSAWGRKAEGLVAVEEEGWGCWVKGRKGVKSHLELYAFPSLSTIHINWIYVAIVRLKPRTPAVLPRRASVTLKAQTSFAGLPVQALQSHYIVAPYLGKDTLSTLMTSTALTHVKRFLESRQSK